jgi:2-isopropylmalate synthase
MTKIELYDTTLRDGMQGEGMSLSAQEKLRVAHRLDELGIDVIEAGFPSSNPKELELFELLADERFEHASIAAFGMTRRRDSAAEEDPGLRVLAGCFAPVCTLVGKTWALHLEKVVKAGRQENLQMIADSVAFLTTQGKRVVYDAEHFFDGFADDPDYALQCLQVAAESGADTVVCCDTNGGTLPDGIAVAMTRVTAELGPDVGIGIHCHDDAGCGVANSLAAVQSGATQVQGTMNGHGERCGNANLVTIIPNLQLAHAHGPLHRRAAELCARLLPALCRPQRVRAQGGHARRGRHRRSGDLRAHRSSGGREPTRRADLRAVGQGHCPRAGPRRRPVA